MKHNAITADRVGAEIAQHDIPAISAAPTVDIMIIILLPLVFLVFLETRSAEIHEPKEGVIDQILPLSVAVESTCLSPQCVQNLRSSECTV